MARIAFLGTGAMGRRMATRLLADHDVVVYNRTPERAADLVAAGATLARTPREATTGADVALSIVTDDAAARQIWLAPDGALAGLSRGAIAVESSTVTPSWVAELASAAHDVGVTLIDAPVAGSTPQAEAGELAWLVGADAADVARVRPVLEAMGRVLHVGPGGQGCVFKLVVNGLFACQVAALSELLAMATGHGLSVTQVVDLLGVTPVASPAALGVGRLIAAEDHAPRFPIDLVEKDLRYAVQAGAGPLVEATRTVFEQASRDGRGGLNLSAVGTPRS